MEKQEKQDEREQSLQALEKLIIECNTGKDLDLENLEPILSLVLDLFFEEMLRDVRSKMGNDADDDAVMDAVMNALEKKFIRKQTFIHAYDPSRSTLTAWIWRIFRYGLVDSIPQMPHQRCPKHCHQP